MMTNPDEVADRRLDANAAAGPLAELFTVDLTIAVATCAGCGNSAPLAAHLLYADAPALVIRCPNCAGVVLRYASSGHRLRLDLTGARLLTVTLPATEPAEGIEPNQSTG
jgi:ribosomal protein S27AE